MSRIETVEDAISFLETYKADLADAMALVETSSDPKACVYRAHRVLQETNYSVAGWHRVQGIVSAAAEKGDPACQLLMGIAWLRRYECVGGTNEGYYLPQAKHWFKKAAAQGNAQAQYEYELLAPVADEVEEEEA